MSSIRAKAPEDDRPGPPPPEIIFPDVRHGHKYGAEMRTRTDDEEESSAKNAGSFYIAFGAFLRFINDLGEVIELGGGPARLGPYTRVKITPMNEHIKESYIQITIKFLNGEFQVKRQNETTGDWYLDTKTTTIHEVHIWFSKYLQTHLELQAMSGEDSLAPYQGKINPEREAEMLLADRQYLRLSGKLEKAFVMASKSGRLALVECEFQSQHAIHDGILNTAHAVFSLFPAEMAFLSEMFSKNHKRNNKLSAFVLSPTIKTLRSEGFSKRMVEEHEQMIQEVQAENLFVIKMMMNASLRLAEHDTTSRSLPLFIEPGDHTRYVAARTKPKEDRPFFPESPTHIFLCPDAFTRTVGMALVEHGEVIQKRHKINDSIRHELRLLRYDTTNENMYLGAIRKDPSFPFSLQAGECVTLSVFKSDAVFKGHICGLTGDAPVETLMRDVLVTLVQMTKVRDGGKEELPGGVQSFHFDVRRKAYTAELENDTKAYLRSGPAGLVHIGTKREDTELKERFKAFDGLNSQATTSKCNKTLAKSLDKILRGICDQPPGLIRPWGDNEGFDLRQFAKNAGIKVNPGQDAALRHEANVPSVDGYIQGQPGTGKSFVQQVKASACDATGKRILFIGNTNAQVNSFAEKIEALGSKLRQSSNPEIQALYKKHGKKPYITRRMFAPETELKYFRSRGQEQMTPILQYESDIEEKVKRLIRSQTVSRHGTNDRRFGCPGLSLASGEEDLLGLMGREKISCREIEDNRNTAVAPQKTRQEPVSDEQKAWQASYDKAKKEHGPYEAADVVGPSP